jgi:mono/diheme cytochrome c family protein
LRRTVGLSIWVIVALLAVTGAYFVTHASISALPDPGPVEKSLAMKAKDWYISRAARAQLPPQTASSADSISKGKALFGMECVTCHGQDGLSPSAIGRSMYPRVPDLGSSEVQEMSDRELFWVVKNGIRLSGMPGFAHINSDQEIWHLAHFVRSLGLQPNR